MTSQDTLTIKIAISGGAAGAKDINLVRRALDDTAGAYGRARDANGRFVAGANSGGSNLAGAAGGISKFKNTLRDVNESATKASDSLLGLGKASLDNAIEYQRQITLLQTAAGETSKNLGLVSDGILRISTATGVTAQQLAEGMYIVEKSGNRGAAGLNVLQAAAQGAVAEGADMTTMTNALTSVMSSYHVPASKAADVMSEIDRAAGLSKTTMQEFAGALSTVIPLASATGLSFAEVGAAIGTLTSHGTSARQATQDLNFTIRALQAPNNVARKEMQQLGIDTADLQKNMGKRGLAGTLDIVVGALGKTGPGGTIVLNAFKRAKAASQDLKVMLASMPKPAADLAKELQAGTITLTGYTKASNALPPQQAVMARQFKALFVSSNGFNDILRSGNPAIQSQVDALKKMMGGSVGLNTALMLTGGSAKGFADRTASISSQVQTATGDIATFHETAGTAANVLARGKAQMAAMSIQLGTMLIPLVVKAGQWFGHLMGWMQKNWSWVSKVALALLGMAAAFKVLSVAMSLITKANIFLTIIAAVAAGLIYAYQHSEKFRNFVKLAWAGIQVAAQAAWPYIKAILEAIGAGFVKLGKALAWAWVNIIAPTWHNIQVAAKWLWNNVLMPVFEAIGVGWTAIANGIDWAWTNILSPAWDLLSAGAMTLWHDVLSPIFTAIGKGWAGLLVGMKWVWDHILSPMFDAIGIAANFLMDNVISPVWDSIKAIWDIVKSVFDTISSAISTAVTAITNALTTVWNALTTFFGSTARAAKSDIQNQASQPISTPAAQAATSGYREQVPSAYVNGGFSGGGSFASGGYVNQMGGRRSDNKSIRVSGGEFVVNANSTTKHRGALEAMNRGYADGGYVGEGYAAQGINSGMLKSAADAINNSQAMKTAGFFLGPTLGVIQKALQATAAAAGPIQVAQTPTGDAVQRWAPLALQALAMTGQSASLLPSMLRRLNQESSGNPNAINLTDSNALKGTPSKGLLQVIDPTFASYAMAGYNTNIFDPLSNMLASIRYAVSTYGSLSSAYDRPGGYDSGGWLMPGQLGQNNLSVPEAVLAPPEWEIAKRALDHVASGGTQIAAGAIQINLMGATDAAGISMLSDALNRVLRDNMERAHS